MAFDEPAAMLDTLRSSLHTLVSSVLRRTWLFALVAVIVCSAFAARAVAAMVEADYLAPATHGPPPLPESARTSAPTRHKPDGSGFVARNMFCSTCEPPPLEPGPMKA